MAALKLAEELRPRRVLEPISSQSSLACCRTFRLSPLRASDMSLGQVCTDGSASRLGHSPAERSIRCSALYSRENRSTGHAASSYLHTWKATMTRRWSRFAASSCTSINKSLVRNEMCRRDVVVLKLGACGLKQVG